MNRRGFLFSTLIAPFAAVLPVPKFRHFLYLKDTPMTAEMLWGPKGAYVYDWQATHTEYTKGVQIERSLWNGEVGPDITLDSLKDFHPFQISP